MMMKLLKVKQRQPKITMNCRASSAIYRNHFHIFTKYTPHTHTNTSNIVFSSYYIDWFAAFISSTVFILSSEIFFSFSHTFTICFVLLLSNMCVFHETNVICSEQQSNQHHRNVFRKTSPENITTLALIRRKGKTFFLRILKHFAVSIYFANCLDLFDAKIFNKIKIGCKY